MNTLGVSLRVCEEQDHLLQWFLFFKKLSSPSVSYQAVILQFSCFPQRTPQAPPLKMTHPLPQQQGLGILSKHIQEGDPSQRRPDSSYTGHFSSLSIAELVSQAGI